MSVALVLTRHVRGDLAQERLWYNQKRAGLGDDLAEDFYSAVDRILTAPSAQSPFGTRFRKRKLKGFPYSVYFYVEADELFVVALVHWRRSAEFVADQLKRS